MAAEALKDVPGGADVEIVERHHRFKEDAPSGTALRFAEIVQDVMGQDRFRPRPRGSARARGRTGRSGCTPSATGDNVGEHSISFGMLGEELEIAVRGRTRDSYANGAVAAASWAVGRPPGLYGMDRGAGAGD